jgi:recombination protein RecA
MTPQQQKALEQVFAAVEKKHGSGSIKMMGDAGKVRGCIPSALEALDHYILGPGGWPWEKISEVYGPESSGKTSLVLAALASVQRIGGIGFHVDAENALSDDRAQAFGVDRETLLLADDLDNAEEAGAELLTALAATPKDVPFLGVFDSVAAMETKAQSEGEVGDAFMSPMARFMSGYMPKLKKALKGKSAHVIMVNQTRVKPGVAFGNPEYTPGGNALKFFASTRIRLGRSGPPRNGGIEVKVKSVKSRFCEPGRELIAFLHFEKGWDDRWTTLGLAKDQKLIAPSSKDYDAAREALGWSMAEAAQRLGASADDVGKISKPRGKKKP